MPSRAELETREAAALAAYAMRSRDSRGRRHPESEHPIRMAFQRDRDRIIHSTAFRRLEYKTQVFVNHEGDYYRTRLTHTMEAAQVTRTLARALGLNEDLAEAVALAHDLGHTPFGHAGERTLDRLMAPHGGFDHNAQSLRIVDLLEERYPTFRAIIDRLVTDLVDHLVAGVAEQRIDSLAAVRRVKPRLVEYSPEIAACNAELKSFLYDRLYTHHRVTRMTQKADRIMTALFEVYVAEPRQLPPHVTRRARDDAEPMPRVIADYVAGMTDRFALEEYKKLFDPYERV